MISTKDRSKLKSIIAKEQDGAIIGKDGLTENVISSIDDLLEAREIVKVKVLNNSDITPREACMGVIQKLNAEPVLVIGNKFVVYRRRKSDKKPHIL